MIIGKYNCHIAYSGIIFHAKSLPMDYCPDFRRRITTKRETILLARCFVGWLFRWLVVLLIVKLQAVSSNNETTLLRYCLPDSSPIYVYNPETSSRVTLASLGTVFQTTKQQNNKTTRQPFSLLRHRQCFGCCWQQRHRESLTPLRISTYIAKVANINQQSYKV